MGRGEEANGEVEGKSREGAKDYFKSLASFVRGRRRPTEENILQDDGLLG